MKTLYITLFFICLFFEYGISQSMKNYDKKTLTIDSNEYIYYESKTKSESVVLLFHDWFGVSDLSFEMLDRISSKGMSSIVLDVYKGKSGKTNAEAQALMNTVDISNAKEYIDKVVTLASKKYKNIYIWGFSLGTQFASQAAINNNSLVKALVLFYGNAARDETQLAKMKFPVLMVMGSKDNPNGAINFFNAINNMENGLCELFIYPNAKHAFAQKLFNGGVNYNEKAKEVSFEIAFRFLKDFEKYEPK